MSLPLRSSALLLLFAGVAACGGSDESEPLPMPPGDVPHTDATRTDTPAALLPLPPESVAVRPAALVDTIDIEGTAEPMPVTLVRTPAGFRLPFSTYVPNDMRVRMQQAGAASGVRIAAAFSGAEQPRAYMYVHMYEPGVSREMVRQEVGGILRTLFPQDDPADAGRLDETWTRTQAPP
jgi:hypothetical protein